MTLRSGPVLRPRALRSLLAVTALVVAGLFGLASSTSVEAAGLEGPATSVSAGSSTDGQSTWDESHPATMLGFVFRDAAGNLATKVRAIGAHGVVCGTGNVQVLSSGDGFYRMEAVGGAVRSGCPSTGGSLSFRLLYGSVDDGAAAIPSQPVYFLAGATFVVSLTPQPAGTSVDWLGTVPASGEDGLLTWVGADETPVEEAIAVLGVPVERLSHYDAGLRRWLSYTPGSPSFAQSLTSVSYGDVVRVRVK